MEIIQGKFKNHKVYVDSAFGKTIGFTSDNFVGTMPKNKLPKKGHIQGQKEGTGSYLYLEEEKSMVIAVVVIEKNKSAFTKMELMVRIAEEGFDCAMFQERLAPIMPVVPPYTWQVSMETFMGVLFRCYSMTKEDVLAHLRPMCLKKIKSTDSLVKEIIQKEHPSGVDMQTAINVAVRLIDSGSPYINCETLSVEETIRRFRAAQVILYGFYFQKNIDMVPPHPNIGDCLLKKNGKKKFFIEWDGSSWVNPEPLHQGNKEIAPREKQ